LVNKLFINFRTGRIGQILYALYLVIYKYMDVRGKLLLEVHKGGFKPAELAKHLWQVDLDQRRLEHEKMDQRDKKAFK
jgi:hypothetical protein